MKRKNQKKRELTRHSQPHTDRSRVRIPPRPFQMTLGRFKFLSFICAFGKFEIKLTKTSNVSGSELSTGKGIAEIKTGNEELVKKTKWGASSIVGN